MGLFKKIFGKKELTWKEKRDLTEQNNKLSNESKENQKSTNQNESKSDLFDLFKDIHEGKSTDNINMDSLPPIFKKMVEDTQVQRQNLEKYWNLMLPVFINMEGQKSIMDLKNVSLSEKIDEMIIVPSGEYENIGIKIKASNPNFSDTLTFGMMDIAKGLSIKEVMTWSLQNLLNRIEEINVIEDNGIYIIEGLNDSTSSITFLSQAWDNLRKSTKIEDEIIFAMPSNYKLLICPNEVNKIDQLKVLITDEKKSGTKLLSEDLYLKKKNEPVKKL